MERSQEKPESASGIGGMTRPIGVVYVPVGLAGCNGTIRFTVVEQDVPPLLPVVIMRTLQASLDLNDDGDKSDLPSIRRRILIAHFAKRTRSFVLTNLIPMVGSSQKILCQNNDEGRATNYMSVIAHVYQRPRCVDDTPAGDHDPTSTRSRRPRQETTPNGDGPARSHPTNPPTTSPRFESGKQIHGAFQNHERDVQTSSRLRPPTDC